jgi:hypothetical protein
LRNISRNHTSVVVTLNVVPESLGLVLVELSILVSIIVSHNPFSKLINLSFELVERHSAVCAVSAIGSKRIGSGFSLECLHKLSSGDLSILVGIKVGDPCFNLGNISGNYASVVVALYISPQSLGLVLVELTILIGVVVGHDPVGDLLEVLLEGVITQNFGLHGERYNTFVLKGRNDLTER